MNKRGVKDITREQILADILTMIEAMTDYYSLSALQTIVQEANKEYTILQLAEVPLEEGKFRLDYVVNKASTEDRFMIQIFADGTSGDFYNTYSNITEVIIAEYNSSQYDI